MEKKMTEINQGLTRRYGAAVAATVAALLIGALVILWSWNTAAVKLFAAPAMAFRHAFAIELGVAVVGTVIAFVSRLFPGGRHPRAAL
jgi:hypothetical protein